MHAMPSDDAGDDRMLGNDSGCAREGERFEDLDPGENQFRRDKDLRTVFLAGVMVVAIVVVIVVGFKPLGPEIGQQPMISHTRSRSVPQSDTMTLLHGTIDVQANPKKLKRGEFVAMNPENLPCRKSPACTVIRGVSGRPAMLIFGGQVSYEGTRNDTLLFGLEDLSLKAVVSQPEVQLLSRENETPTLFRGDNQLEFKGKKRYDEIKGNQWYILQNEAVAPPERWKSSLVTVGSSKKDRARALLFGGAKGFGAGEIMFDDLWLFDVRATSRWTKLGDGKGASNLTWPEARRAHSGAMLGSRLVIFGGKDAFGRTLEDAWSFNFEEYKKHGSVKWERIQPQFPGGARKGHSAVAYQIGNKHEYGMVVFGGRKNGHEYHNDVWQLAMVPDKTGKGKTVRWSWELLEKGGRKSLGNANQRPGFRNHHSAVYYRGEMLIFGGRSSHSFYKAHEDAWAFDTINTRKWKELDRKKVWPAARMEHCAASYGSQMYIYAGQGNGGERRNDLWAYSIDTASWSELSPNQCHAPVLATSTLLMGCIIFGLGTVLILFRYYSIKNDFGYQSL